MKLALDNLCLSGGVLAILKLDYTEKLHRLMIRTLDSSKPSPYGLRQAAISGASGDTNLDRDNWVTNGEEV